MILRGNHRPLFLIDNIGGTGIGGVFSMSISDLMTLFETYKDEVISTTVLLGIFGAVIEISPLKINPWSWIGKLIKALIGNIGVCFNKPLMDKFDSRLDKMDQRITELGKKMDDRDSAMTQDIKTLNDEVKALRAEIGANEAREMRGRIIRFADEIRCDQIHSSEHYNELLLDITNYETYCSEHPDFKNNVATEAIRLIKEKNYQHSINRDFLEFRVGKK